MDILTILSTPIPAYFTLGPLIILLLVLLVLIMKKSPVSPGIAVIPQAQVQIQQPQAMSMPPIPVVQAAIPIISSIPVQPSTPVTPGIEAPVPIITSPTPSAPEAFATEIIQSSPAASPIVEKVDTLHVSQAPSVATTPATAGSVTPVTSWQPAAPATSI